MTQWAAFVGLAGVVTLALLLLSVATKTTLTGPSPTDAGRSSRDGHSSESTVPRDRTLNRDGGESRADSTGEAGTPTVAPGREPGSEPTAPAERSTDDGASTGATSLERADGADPLESMSTGALLANVALSQGLFATLLLAAALYFRVPADALGLEFSRPAVLTGFALGTGLGLALYGANELGSLSAKRLGIDHSEDLRRMLAPDGVAGWLVLLLAVLPVIAFFEEFLFRAALIGVVSSGFDVSPWLLAVASSIAFALGHGMQGTAGIVVTGLLGFALAAAFVYTGSLLVVVVAHYLVNALEFVVHEGLGLEWADAGSESAGN